MSSDLVKAKREMWARMEKKILGPGRSFPKDFQGLVEKMLPGGIHDDENLTDLEDYIPELWRVYELGAKSTLHEHLAQSKDWVKERYPKLKPLEHRFHLALFVINSSSHRQRIDWKWVTKEWNNSHPYAPTTPATLKRNYNRAIKDPRLSGLLITLKEHLARFPWESVTHERFWRLWKSRIMGGKS